MAMGCDLDDPAIVRLIKCVGSMPLISRTQNVGVSHGSSMDHVESPRCSNEHPAAVAAVSGSAFGVGATVGVGGGVGATVGVRSRAGVEAVVGVGAGPSQARPAITAKARMLTANNCFTTAKLRVGIIPFITAVPPVLSGRRPEGRGRGGWGLPAPGRSSTPATPDKHAQTNQKGDSHAQQ